MLQVGMTSRTFLDTKQIPHLLRNVSAITGTQDGDAKQSFLERWLPLPSEHSSVAYADWAL